MANPSESYEWKVCPTSSSEQDPLFFHKPDKNSLRPEVPKLHVKFALVINLAIMISSYNFGNRSLWVSGEARSLIRCKMSVSGFLISKRAMKNVMVFWSIRNSSVGENFHFLEGRKTPFQSCPPCIASTLAFSSVAPSLATYSTDNRISKNLHIKFWGTLLGALLGVDRPYTRFFCFAVQKSCFEALSQIGVEFLNQLQIWTV